MMKWQGSLKKYLKSNVNKRSKKVLSIRSQYHILRHVNRFFTWLSGQAGYKSRIDINNVQFLQLSKKERRIATGVNPQKYPTLAQVKSMTLFPVESEIDQRDQALISFMALSGIRDRAVTTLPIGCFDPSSLVIDQNPSRGVETKFSKQIQTTLFKIDDELVKCVVDWYTYLVEVKKFSLHDPLFPATKIGHVSKNHSAFEAKGVSNDFWADAGPVRRIFKERAKQTNTPYFTPHKFRHFILNESLKHVSSMEQLKAISQNLGHEQMATTFYGYGLIDDSRVSELIQEINFSGLPQDKSQEEQAKKIAQIVLEQMNKN